MKTEREEMVAWAGLMVNGGGVKQKESGEMGGRILRTYS